MVVCQRSDTIGHKGLKIASGEGSERAAPAMNRMHRLPRKALAFSAFLLEKDSKECYLDLKT